MGSHRSKYGGNVLIWTSPEAEPVTGIQMQVLLEVVPGNTSRGERGTRTEREGSQ